MMVKRKRQLATDTQTSASHCEYFYLTKNLLVRYNRVIQILLLLYASYMYAKGKKAYK